MIRSDLRMGVAIALALVGAASQGATGRPGRAAGGSPPAARIDREPFQTALAALDNYQSCGVSADSPAFAALMGALQAAEALARRKGLGRELDRERAQYQMIRTVSISVACAGGPAGARADARRAVEAFQAWAAAQPAR
jgi:hypothetical protein